jgi:hypothetical protein
MTFKKSRKLRRTVQVLNSTADSRCHVHGLLATQSCTQLSCWSYGRIYTSSYSTFRHASLCQLMPAACVPQLPQHLTKHGAVVLQVVQVGLALLPTPTSCTDAMHMHNTCTDPRLYSSIQAHWCCCVSPAQANKTAGSYCCAGRTIWRRGEGRPAVLRTTPALASLLVVNYSDTMSAHTVLTSSSSQLFLSCLLQ